MSDSGYIEFRKCVICRIWKRPDLLSEGAYCQSCACSLLKNIRSYVIELECVCELAGTDLGNELHSLLEKVQKMENDYC